MLLGSDELVREITYHVSKDHEYGCPQRHRQNLCDCRYNMKTDGLLQDAVRLIKEQKTEIDRLQYKLERGYL